MPLKMFKCKTDKQRTPVRAAPPPPAEYARTTGFVRSVSQPSRRPVLEVVERHGSMPDGDPPPPRPARASGRRDRAARKTAHSERRASEQPALKKSPPPRPPPPNLQAALGSPPSYEETLKMDSAVAGRLTAPPGSGNPFLLGGAPSGDPPAAAHCDLSAPAVTSVDRSCYSGAAALLESVSRTSSLRSSVDSASRRSSASPSVEGVPAQSGAAVTTESPTRAPATDESGGMRRSSLPAESVLRCSGTESSEVVSSSRSGHNPFLPSAAGEEQSPADPAASVAAPPRHSRPGGDPATISTVPGAGWAGRVSRAPGERHASPFSRDGPGRTAHHGTAFGREAAWAGRVSRGDDTARGTLVGSGGMVCRDGGTVVGVAGSVSSGSLSRVSGASAEGVTRGLNHQSAGALTSSPSVSPSASCSTSPTNSPPASPVNSPPPSPPASPPASPPPSRPASSAPGLPAPPSDPLSSPLLLTVHTTVSHDSAGDSTGESAAHPAGESASQLCTEAVAPRSISPAGSRRSGVVSSARSSATSLDGVRSLCPAGAGSNGGRTAVVAHAPAENSSPVETTRRGGAPIETTRVSVPSIEAVAKSGASAEITGRNYNPTEAAEVNGIPGEAAEVSGAPAEAAEVRGAPGDTAGRSAPAEAKTLTDRDPATAVTGAGADCGDSPQLNWGLRIEPIGPDTPQAVAMYDFQSSAPGDLNFKAGECLVLLRRVTADWLLCQLGGRHGLVPAHHVRETVPLPAAAPAPAPNTPVEEEPTTPDGQRVMALYDFAPQEKYDLGFQAGDMLTVLGKLNDDWGYGRRRGHSGQFPLAYVDVAVDTLPAI